VWLGEKKPKTEVWLEKPFICHKTVCFATSGHPLVFVSAGECWSMFLCSVVRALGGGIALCACSTRRYLGVSVRLGAGAFELWF
jgi:hypothetical protein